MQRLIKADTFNFRTVLATDRNLGSPRMATIDISKVTRPPGSAGYLPAGVLIADTGNGLGTPYPATKAGVATPSGQTTISLRNTYLFKAGDALVAGAGATAIGTVASVDPEASTVTLAAPSAAAIAAADSVYVAAPTTGIIGIAVHLIDLNLSIDVACYTMASVYKAMLPFWSSAIASQLPLITLVPRP